MGVHRGGGGARAPTAGGAVIEHFCSECDCDSCENVRAAHATHEHDGKCGCPLAPSRAERKGFVMSLTIEECERLAMLTGRLIDDGGGSLTIDDMRALQALRISLAAFGFLS